MNNDFILKNGSGGLSCKGCGRQNNKLNTYDWLADVPGNGDEQEIVEVQFKNTRKGYFKNSNRLKLEKGDIVAVEASPGHDIGTVTLTGRLVPLQMRKSGMKPDTEIKRIYRKVKPIDMEKYEEAKSREHDTMIRSRKIAEDLGLQMKIGDVEYQGDGNKAIFYYIADERVDFRQLIKVLAEAFRVRIEMKQIGARQEAGRIGGIGPCGRELCCATWMTSFVSVSTSAARFQDISLNPQKLAGQCAKLKCCLNYEVDAYVECQKRLPSKEVVLETQDASYYYFKADILGGTITYSTDKSFLANEVTISARRAFEVLNMNKRGEKPLKLNEETITKESDKPKDLLEQESVTRFDKSKNSRNKKKKNKNETRGENNISKNNGRTNPGKPAGNGEQPNEPKRPVTSQESAATDSNKDSKAVVKVENALVKVENAPKENRNRDKQPRENRPSRDKNRSPKPNKNNKERENTELPEMKTPENKSAEKQLPAERNIPQAKRMEDTENQPSRENVQAGERNNNRNRNNRRPNNRRPNGGNTSENGNTEPRKQEGEIHG
ncbi:regulatory iron-sulfur-containing complex subunit RicT [uncultured Phocaeicola sp.]|jgi:cell fate regulator YaaT (PSP1 superfamily)|uniref:PSP1 domain-containing protein n=1 Tax=uncultured Phocaeicola sp. TaxID=990718 RepID=UPI0015A82014|nr:regulatory iron-sulfur-containing complex subunit RicT [uncultured Phocaeicola sp.]